MFILKAIPNPDAVDSSAAHYFTRSWDKPWAYDPADPMVRKYPTRYAALLAAAALMAENSHWKNVRGYQVCDQASEMRKDRVW